jgi:hypothetical protein
MTVSTRGRTSKILLQVEQVPPFMQTASRLFLLSSRNVMWAGNDLKVLISHLKEPLNPLLLASFCWRKKIDSRAGCCYCMLIFLLAFLVETASSIRRPSFVFFLWYEENLAKGFDFLLRKVYNQGFLQDKLSLKNAHVSIWWKEPLLFDAVCIRDSSLVFFLWNEDNVASNLRLRIAACTIKTLQDQVSPWWYRQSCWTKVSSRSL